MSTLREEPKDNEGHDGYVWSQRARSGIGAFGGRSGIGAFGGRSGIGAFGG